MKTAGKLLAGLSMALVLGLIARADDKKAEGKEVTLNGTITCAKCDLHKTAKCATVIKVKEDGKDVVYYFDKASHGKNHGTICMEPKEGSVTGVKGEADGKKTIKVSKVEFK